MTVPSFQRARSPESKRQRSQALVEAARSLALEKGVASVTLTAVARRAGVHHSAVRRYFDSHKDVLLQLAAEGWNNWSGAVCQALRGRTVTPGELAEVLATTLAADPLLCDLLANVPLHLEHDVDVERVIEFKNNSRDAIAAMAEAITSAAPSLSDGSALDVVLAADALAATLWQVAHPADALAAALAGPARRARRGGAGGHRAGVRFHALEIVAHAPDRFMRAFQTPSRLQQLMKHDRRRWTSGRRGVSRATTYETPTCGGAEARQGLFR